MLIIPLSKGERGKSTELFDLPGLILKHHPREENSGVILTFTPPDRGITLESINPDQQEFFNRYNT
jgi:hypothetical protein